MVRRVVRYEEIILDTNFKRAARPLRSYNGKLFNFFLNGNAASRAPVSQANKSRLSPFAAKVEVLAETYTVALQATNQPFATDGVTFHSDASAREFLARQIEADSRFADLLHVIPSHEVSA
jgi:hypothetical protein